MKNLIKVCIRPIREVIATDAKVGPEERKFRFIHMFPSSTILLHGHVWCHRTCQDYSSTWTSLTVEQDNVKVFWPSNIRVSVWLKKKIILILSSTNHFIIIYVLSIYLTISSGGLCLTKKSRELICDVEFGIKKTSKYFQCFLNQTLDSCWPASYIQIILVFHKNFMP